jgi:hypothetical protein
MSRSSDAILALIATDTPAGLRFAPRAGTLPAAEIATRVRRFAAERKLDATRAEALEALAHVWHDHEAEAHAILQRHEGERDFDYVHAMLHRREGDLGNAAYWFAQVGTHPIHQRLVQAARAVDLDCEVSGVFSPTAFLNLVRDYAGEAPRGQTLDHGRWADDLVSVQDAEFRLLAEHLAG